MNSKARVEELSLPAGSHPVSSLRFTRQRRTSPTRLTL
jgi:hypothetical protein